MKYDVLTIKSINVMKWNNNNELKIIKTKNIKSNEFNFGNIEFTNGLKLRTYMKTKHGNTPCNMRTDKLSVGDKIRVIYKELKYDKFLDGEIVELTSNYYKYNFEIIEEKYDIKIPNEIRRFIKDNYKKDLSDIYNINRYININEAIKSNEWFYKNIDDYHNEKMIVNLLGLKTIKAIDVYCRGILNSVYDGVDIDIIRMIVKNENKEIYKDELFNNGLDKIKRLLFKNDRTNRYYLDKYND